MLSVSFPAAKMIDANGIDVSDGGMAAVKILAEAAKKESAKVRIRARSSSAPPPKELRSLFRTAGEMNAVRAARVMSSLQGAGVPPARITIVGDVADKSAPRAGHAARRARRRSAQIASSSSSNRRVAACPGARRLALLALLLAGSPTRRRLGARPTSSPSTCARSGRATRCAASVPTAATSCCRGAGSRSTWT